MYKVKPYQLAQASKLSVIIKPSTKGSYKLDVFDREGNYITSIGDKRYSDYATYVQEKGLDYANKRRRLYWQRHQKDSQVEGSRGWLAARLLW